MQIRNLHSWKVSTAQAREIQERLAKKIRLKPLTTTPKIIAGLDCAFTKDKQNVIACIVLFTFPELTLIETRHTVEPVLMPYIPGLLSFREAPACLKAAKKLQNTPDLFIVDGQGIAHPRRLGLASHLGLFLNVPTIGCAKSRLIGTYQQPPEEKGQFTDLYHKNDLIGAVVRTRTSVKPLFVSPGHLCSFNDAVKYTLETTTRYRLPETSRSAHRKVTEIRKSLK